MPDVTDTFTRPCLDCGSTLRIVGARERAHDCKPINDRAGAIAKAYWSGYDQGCADGEVRR